MRRVFKWLNTVNSGSKHQKSRGDTIIEVLLSTTIIATALAGGFALSGHSINTATRTQQRSEALSLAQSQIEFIKNAFANLSPLLFQLYYQGDNSYCVTQAGNLNYSVDSNGLCQNYLAQTPPSPYAVGISYNSGDNVFTVTGQWPSTSGNSQDELELYYKTPGLGAPICDPLVDDCGCAPTCPSPDFKISASPKSLSIEQGSNSHITVTTAISNGFNAAINLSTLITQKPAGGNLDLSFRTNPILAPGNGTSRLKINTDSGTATGTYKVKITGDGGGKSHYVTVTVKVTSPGGGSGGSHTEVWCYFINPDDSEGHHSGPCTGSEPAGVNVRVCVDDATGDFLHYGDC